MRRKKKRFDKKEKKAGSNEARKINITVEKKNEEKANSLKKKERETRFLGFFFNILIIAI